MRLCRMLRMLEAVVLALVFALTLDIASHALGSPTEDAILAQGQQGTPAPIAPPVITAPPGAATVEQKAPGTKPAATLVASFDGLGVGFDGPQGASAVRNPSDNSLAVGPNHIVQIVNTRMAIFTKKGKQFDTTGKALYGSVNTNNVFKGFGGTCEERNNGDAVVRYDQLADRWLIVMPIFGRAPARPDQPGEWKAGEPAHVSPPGRPGQPGRAAELFRPPPPSPSSPAPAGAEAQRGRGGQSGQPGGRGREEGVGPQGPYGMCYAVSVGPDPFGPYYRYEFLRPLFPDYPRPAIWLDGYYIPSSSSYEYAMLYGIQRPLQFRLVKDHRPLRVLISYGEFWFPWYMRRLAERPANAGFVIKNLFAR
jgi:hypothetical protein